MRFVDLVELKIISVGWMQHSSLTVIQSYPYGHPAIHDIVIPSGTQVGGTLMQIDAILCNHAEAVNNLLYIAGGGIEISFVQAGAAPPYPVNIGIGIMVTVPWGQTNQQHTVEVELISEDGQPVQVPVMPDVMQPLHSRLAFNVGRPPGMTVGDDQHVCLAANLPALPMPSLGKYEFIIRVDGHDERRLPYRVMPAPGTQIIAGPSSLPGPSKLPA
jgi:hypothetical protein